MSRNARASNGSADELRKLLRECSPCPYIEYTNHLRDTALEALQPPLDHEIFDHKESLETILNKYGSAEEARKGWPEPFEVDKATRKLLMDIVRVQKDMEKGVYLKRLLRQPISDPCRRYPSIHEPVLTVQSLKSTPRITPDQPLPLPIAISQLFDETSIFMPPQTKMPAEDLQIDINLDDTLDLQLQVDETTRIEALELAKKTVQTIRRMQSASMKARAPESWLKWVEDIKTNIEAAPRALSPPIFTSPAYPPHLPSSLSQIQLVGLGLVARTRTSTRHESDLADNDDPLQRMMRSLEDLSAPKDKPRSPKRSLDLDAMATLDGFDEPPYPVNTPSSQDSPHRLISPFNKHSKNLSKGRLDYFERDISIMPNSSIRAASMPRNPPGKFRSNASIPSAFTTPTRLSKRQVSMLQHPHSAPAVQRVTRTSPTLDVPDIQPHTPYSDPCRGPRRETLGQSIQSHRVMLEPSGQDNEDLDVVYNAGHQNLQDVGEEMRDEAAETDNADPAERSSETHEAAQMTDKGQIYDQRQTSPNSSSVLALTQRREGEVFELYEGLTPDSLPNTEYQAQAQQDFTSFLSLRELYSSPYITSLVQPRQMDSITVANVVQSLSTEDREIAAGCPHLPSPSHKYVSGGVLVASSAGRSKPPSSIYTQDLPDFIPVRAQTTEDISLRTSNHSSYAANTPQRESHQETAYSSPSGREVPHSSPHHLVTDEVQPFTYVPVGVSKNKKRPSPIVNSQEDGGTGMKKQKLNYVTIHGGRSLEEIASSRSQSNTRPNNTPQLPSVQDGLTRFLELRDQSSPNGRSSKGSTVKHIQRRPTSSQGKRMSSGSDWRSSPIIQNPKWLESISRMTTSDRVIRAITPLDFFKQRDLVRALQAGNIELIERENTQHVDLILSAKIGLIFRPLQTLPKHLQEIIDRLKLAAKYFHEVILIFDILARDNIDLNEGEDSALLDPLNQNVTQALSRLQRAMSLTIQKGQNDVIGSVQILFAKDGPTEMARTVQALHERELNSFTAATGGVNDRVLKSLEKCEWVLSDESPDERALVEHHLLHSYIAAYLLHRTGSLKQLMRSVRENGFSGFASTLGKDVSTTTLSRLMQPTMSNENVNLKKRIPPRNLPLA